MTSGQGEISTHSLEMTGSSISTYAVFTLLIALKSSLLILFGPVFTPDSSGYSDMARTMLESTAWLHTGQSPFSFRIIGYPAILAAAMLVGGSFWSYVVVFLQCVISLCAVAAMLRLGCELGLSRGLSLFAVTASATSLQLTLDQCILTDSLNASFVIFAIVLIVQGARDGHPFSPAAALAAGLLLALAFLVREIMQVLIVVFLPLLLVRVIAATKGGRARTFAGAILVVAPVLITVAAYREWNNYRTGERFVTTGAQTALLIPVVEAAKHDLHVLDGDTPLDLALRSHVQHYTFGEIIAVNAELSAEGYRPTEIARLVTARYIGAWRQHPVAMLLFVRSKLSENQAKLAVRPFAAVCEIIEWGHSEPQCPDYRDVYQKLLKTPSSLTLGELGTFVAVTVQNALSIVLFAAFLIGVPVLIIAQLGRSLLQRETRPAPMTPLLIAGGLWLLYCGWDFAYVMLTFENRYLAPIVPLSIFCGFYALQQAVRWIQEHSRKGRVAAHA